MWTGQVEMTFDKHQRLIIPTGSALNELTDLGIKFLNDYEIGLTGLFEELLRLVMSTNTRYEADVLQSLISRTMFTANWERLHEHVYPRFTYEEALDRWLTIVTAMYYHLNRILKEVTEDFYVSRAQPIIKIHDVSRLNGDLMIVCEIDYLPF